VEELGLLGPHLGHLRQRVPRYHRPHLTA
jgi:hypothetical protein